MKQRDVDLIIDFVRWYDAKFPDNQMSTSELREFIEPHIQEYWSRENLIDDTYQFFSKVMGLDEEHE